MASERVCTLHGVHVDHMWGSYHRGKWVYEACNKVLADGKVCALGPSFRIMRIGDPSLPGSPLSRPRGPKHICSPIGDGIYRFNFSVKVGNIVLQVWEEAGHDIMGMTGQEFFDSYSCDQVARDRLCAEIQSTTWIVTYKEIGGTNSVHHAVSFVRCPELKCGAVKSEKCAVPQNEGNSHQDALVQTLAQLTLKLLEK